MASLFDFSDPQNAGLMGLSAGLLQAGGPSPFPRSLGQGLGTGLLQAAEMQRAAMEANRRSDFINAQVQHLATEDAVARASMERARQQATALQNFFSQPTADPAQLALAQGAAVGDIGPTATNAQRMTAAQQQVPNFDSLLAAGVDPKIVNAARENWTLRNPNVQYQGGIPLHPRTAQPIPGGTVVPQTNQQGFSTTPRFNPVTRQFEVGVTPGAETAFATQQSITKAPSPLDRAQFEAARMQQFYNTGVMPPPIPGPAFGAPRGTAGAPTAEPGVPPLPIPSPRPAGAPQPSPPGLTPKAAGELSQKRAEEQAKLQQALPDAIAKSQQAIDVIDQMIGSPPGTPKDKQIPQHPGFQPYVGATLRPFARLIEGSDPANFEALLKQVTGGAFMQAYETLKGGGQITEIEGKKATQAITRMSKSQSETEFTKAAREFQDVLRAGIERAKTKAGVSPASQQGWSIKPL